MRVWSAIPGIIIALLIQWSPSPPALAAVLCPDKPTERVRLDCRTVIVKPTADDDRIRMDAFLGFRALSNEPRQLLLILPVTGPIESVKAQAMTLAAFDQTYTNGENLETAFYRAARSRAKGRLCTQIGIGAVGGAPGWILLAAYWPKYGPSLTAVVPPQPVNSKQLPAVTRVDVIRGDDLLRRLPRDAPSSIRDALQKHRWNSCIVASVIAPGTPSEAQQCFADSGIRISFESALEQEEGDWVFRLPLVSDPLADAPALSRYYVVSPPNRRAALHLPYEFDQRRSPQRMVKDVLSLFDRPERVRLARAREAKCARMMPIGISSGGETLRAVATFQPADEEMVVTFQRRPVGAIRGILPAAGMVLDGLLWPLAAVVMLAGIWYAMHTYFWLMQVSPPASPWRSYAWIVLLGPLLTPWFMLRYLSLGKNLLEDPDKSGALGVLPVRTYECLVRVLLWALIVCVNWALIGGLADLAYWLRFG